MEEKKKKVAAINSALISYMQMEQAAYAPQVQTAQQEKPAPIFPVGSPWSLSGRQAIMDRRYQMQMRMFR